MSVINLRWLYSVLVSCFHATRALLRRRQLIDSRLAAALSEPAKRLQEALLEEHIPPDKFWAHLIPLAAGIGSLHELAEVTLTKTIGHESAAPRAGRYRGLLADLKIAFSAAVSATETDLAEQAGPLIQQWNYHGLGLLGRIPEITEPGVLVDEATVVLVYPVLGGGGGAHLPYNVVHMEAVTPDPVAELPEVVRLAWLLSMLNLDLPRYSENVRPNQLVTVAGLAMVPVTLAAAAEVQLTGPEPETLPLALQAWMTSGDQLGPWTATLNDWWETYRTMRPAWGTALKALDMLLADSKLGDQSS